MDKSLDGLHHICNAEDSHQSLKVICEYPSRWLVAALNARGVSFCMRVEKAGNAGFACVRDFLRSDDAERIVTLAAPDRRDAVDYECPATPQTVRLVRHIASTGKVRVLRFCRIADQATKFPCEGTDPLKLDGPFLPK